MGDEDLLEIIGNSKDPLQVQRHVSKMFAAIATLEVQSDGQHSKVTGMVSREGEAVLFDKAVHLADAPKINEWLGAVEHQMHVSLATLAKAVLGIVTGGSDFSGASFLEWSHQFPAQIVLLATSVSWSDSVEKALPSSGLDQSLDRIQNILQMLADEVLRDDLDSSRRKTYEQLITELVHQRDSSRRLRGKSNERF